MMVSGGSLRNILLLTSTIAPRPGLLQGVRNDPLQRLADYRFALALYLNALEAGAFDLIVYADNSGYPLDVLRQQVADRGLDQKVVFQSFEAQTGPDHGRFYLELDLLRTSMNLPPLQNIDNDVKIWKVTGRYIIRNIAQLVKSMPENGDIWLNSRNYPVAWTDFFIAGFTKSGFQRLFSDQEFEGYAHTNEPGEMRLHARIASKDFSDLDIMLRMPKVPRVEGVRAYDGARYAGVKGSAKYFGRVVMSRLMPWVWV